MIMYQKKELLKSLTKEYLLFLREVNKINNEARIKYLNFLKEELYPTVDMDELDNALYWTISNYITSMKGNGVSSVTHMISYTNSLLEDDEDWIKQYFDMYRP
jgi:hypothetical protein